ncbi:MAG: shikimate dehydrogenase [Myxococcales bacterium FL481]|nr:MAG: shikimate dehydrogenase [Myxococcales bacterium FL481]
MDGPCATPKRRTSGPAYTSRCIAGSCLLEWNEWSRPAHGILLMTSSLARCFGVFGHPIAHSRSPAMHTAALTRLGLGHRYLPFAVAPADLPAAIAGAKAMGFGGVNLTVPHKQAVLPLLDDVADEARRIGAVNTVAFVGGRAIGHNTDGRGFLRGLSELGAGEVTRATVLGAGGASRAVIEALCSAYPRAQIRWVSRTPLAQESSRGGVRTCSYAQLHAEPLGDLLVNTTTVGMPGGPTEFPATIDLAGSGPDLRVVDLVYAPAATDAAAATPLVQQAQRLGLSAQDGRPMLLWQGVLALATWLDREIEPEVVAVMRAALD